MGPSSRSGSPVHSVGPLSLPATGCGPGEAFIQALDCGGGQLNLWRRRSEFSPWGGILPFPYYFLTGDGGICGYFNEASPVASTPGQLLVGEITIADCDDDRCPADLYVQSRRCPGGELRSVWRKRSEFAPWGGPYPWPYYWTVVQQGACGYFDDTCPVTELPGALLVNDREIPDCNYPGCDEGPVIGCGSPPRCPATVTVIISGTGFSSLDGPHGLQWNGEYWVEDQGPPFFEFVRLNCGRGSNGDGLWTVDCSTTEGAGCYAVATKEWGLWCAPPGVYTLIGSVACTNVTFTVSG